MRIAIITETFTPDLNGVAHSVVRSAEHLRARGHDVVVIAPEPPDGAPRAPDCGYTVVRVPSVPMVGYKTFRIGLPSRRVSETLWRFGPDVVHLAAPFALGAHGLAAANRMDLPTVAIYQTDVPKFAAGYGLGFAGEVAWRWIRRLHNAAGRTLAPSTHSIEDLTSHGVQRVHLWRRGVDTERFHPRNRDEDLHADLSRGGVVVGYVGRLAPEKHLHLLADVSRMEGVRLVFVGDGPARGDLEAVMPNAAFLGERTGDDLARIYASFDIFAHTGPYETFCQTVQEALASGLAVVAPDRGGPRDLVAHGRTGLLVPPFDAEAVTGAVARLVEQPAYRRRLASVARASVAGRSWGAIGDELIGHYEDTSGRALAGAA